MSEVVATEDENKEPQVNSFFLFIANLLIYVGGLLGVLLLVDEFVPLKINFLYLSLPMLFAGSFFYRYLTRERNEWRRRFKHTYIFSGEVVVEDLFIYAARLTKYDKYKSRDESSYTLLYYCLIINDEWYWVSPVTDYTFKYNQITIGSRLQVKVYEQDNQKIIAEASIVEIAPYNNLDDSTIIQEKYLGLIPKKVNEFRQVEFEFEITDDEEALYDKLNFIVKEFSTNTPFSQMNLTERNLKYACLVNSKIELLDWQTFKNKKVNRVFNT